MNVAVTGTLALDYIMDFPGRFADRIMPEKIHKISLSFLVDSLNKQFGGTAGNIAYTLKLLGAEPLVVSCAGNDFSSYLSFWKTKKISTKYVRVHKDTPTSSYFVVTDQDDNQIGSFYVGATKYAKTLSVLAVKPRPTFCIVAPTDPVAMKKYVQECITLGLPYMYDPSFQVATFTKEELQDGIAHAQILIGNDYEIALIEEKLEITHEDLIVMVPVLVTTLGAKGSIIETRKDAMHAKSARVKNASDPTGAGDAYRAGFISGYLRNFDLQICGQMGSVAAAFTVEKYGTQTHTFTKKEFVKRYEENFRGILKL